MKKYDYDCTAIRVPSYLNRLVGLVALRENMYRWEVVEKTIWAFAESEYPELIPLIEKERNNWITQKQRRK